MFKGIYQGMQSLFNKILKKDGEQKKVLQFSPHPYFKTDLDVQSLHELSHAIAMALNGQEVYKKIGKKSISVGLSFGNKSGVFCYSYLDDPSGKELFVDMMISLAGFVGEFEFLDLQSTSSSEDMIAWGDYSRKWLLHYNRDYISHTNNDHEIEWNNKILNDLKHRQKMMLKKLLRNNDDLIYEYIEKLEKHHHLDNDDLNIFLDRVDIPLSVLKEMNQIIEKGKTNWY